MGGEAESRDGERLSVLDGRTIGPNFLVEENVDSFNSAALKPHSSTCF